MATEVIGTDAAGYEVITEAMMSLLNDFPGLADGEAVKFEELGAESGIAFSNNSGALIYTEKEDILGGVYQTCQYPFFIVYRAAASAKESQKRQILNFLDMFGKWICRESAVIDDTAYTLDEWPELADGREITKITRDNAYASEPYENGSQDWVLPVTVFYDNEFQRH